MFRGILPKEFAFFDYFEKHIGITIQISNELMNLALGKSTIKQSIEIINNLERQADEITHTCTEAVHKTFITPIERADIHNLIKRLDDIADFMDGAVFRMGLYEITVIRPEIKEIAEVLCNITKEIENALKGLRNLKNVDYINQSCINIHKLENRGDEILRKVLSKIFKEEECIQIIIWKEIFERLEKSIDRCESVANIIEGIVIASA